MGGSRALAAGLAAAVQLLGCSGEAPRSSSRPAVKNLLLVTVDTLRHDALGFAGNPAVATPNLDRLAAQGVVFERAYAHNVVTLPSHVNILTGLLPYQHGVRDNDGFVLEDSLPTAASWLAARGFATAAFVAAFPLDRRFGLERGFEVYDDRYPRALGERPGDQVVAGALDWWRSREGSRRFLWVHLYDPHAPYEPPRPAPDPYLGEVDSVDAYLAPLLELVTADEASTLVLFTADHGEALGEHGERTHGLFAYESVLRVPLVLRAPGLAPAQREDVASHVDLLPTALAALGVKPPPGLPGRDVLGPGAGRPHYFESVTGTQELGAAPLRGVLDGAFKLIQLPKPELYDVVSDPAEQSNLIDQRRDVAQRLAAELPEETAWPPRRNPEAPAAAEGLRALGYLGGTTPLRDAYGVADDPKNLVELQTRMQEAVDRMRAGHLTEAEALIRTVLAERDVSMAYHYLAFNLLEQERVAEAVAVMERSRELELASPRLLRQLGLSLAELGRHAEAQAVLEPLAEGGDPRALHDLASALSAAGEQDAAERTLRRLLEIDPDDPEAYQTLAQVALRRGNAREAAALAERALGLDDGLATACSLLGEASYELGEYDRAAEAWERAVAIDPADYGALYNLTLVAEELGDREGLRRALERFIGSSPPQPFAPHLESARARLERLQSSGLPR